MTDRATDALLALPAVAFALVLILATLAMMATAAVTFAAIVAAAKGL